MSATQSRVLHEALRIVEEGERAATGLAEPKVAYLGPLHSHSHEAAAQAFSDTELVPCLTFRSMFQRLYEREVDYALLPIQNSINGSITEPLGELFEWTDKDPIKKDRVAAFGDHFMRIRNYLAGKPGASADFLQVIYTKDEAHRQCTEWLAQHNLDGHVEHVGSTSQAAEIVRKGKRTRAAAICTRSAAEHNGLELLVPEPVTDEVTNTTRFLKLKLTSTPAPECSLAGPDVTLLFVVLQDEPGILYRVLSIFGRRGFNLSHLANAPLKPRMRISPEFGNWFLMEFQASISDERFVQTLEKLQKRRELYYAMKVVGSFRTDRLEARSWPA